ncbi:TCP-1/cpn60 chaperonin family protein [Tritrichomonas foetus]|uniref:TCP-1/cpn60 chaperonin family protein n=1 Tax=Tritrichomonas foetus TaxID=1144522 RepID=A0A1J4JXI8_9EUKA|nr:TCP-1/cpn60 chaperonin family protein [Tritrichomonas foetus]|eukprot:OHT03176.1 TCP-1/cpn60 chaperonin family protein [Tritrichomonas foetus]
MSRREEQQSQIFKKDQAQNINFQSCHLLNDLMKTNIGPFGSIKMLESEKGELKLTKSGGELIRQLTIIHPTALLIGRAANAQDKAFHDGVSSIICFISALLEQSEYKLSDRIHPRVLVKGLEKARDFVLKQLDELSIPLSDTRSDLCDYVNSSALTKSPMNVSNIVVDAIHCIKEEDKQIDMDRVEVFKIQSARESARLVKGLVLEMGFRHDLMAKKMEKVRILALNVSLELEDTVVKTIMPVSNADERERMTIAERKFVDNKIRSIIELRDAVGGDFLLVNGKGIDQPSLDMLAHANISALRRVSRKTLQRLVFACGCRVVNCVDDLFPAVLGYAEKVTEEEHNKVKYVFIDEVQSPKAVSIVLGGMNVANLDLTETAVKSGLRALQNADNDKKLLPGAGATEIALSIKLQEYKKTLEAKDRLGVEIFSEALLSIPRTLMKNSGLNPSEIIGEMLNEAETGELAGVDLETGEVMDPTVFGIYDNYCVKRGIFQSAPIVASQLLLVDEIIQSTKVKEAKKKSED